MSHSRQLKSVTHYGDEDDDGDNDGGYRRPVVNLRDGSDDDESEVGRRLASHDFDSGA